MPSMLCMQILRHISFFNPKSEYLEYTVKKEIQRYKSNTNPAEVSEEQILVISFIG
jgi:hypothetical protein